MLDKLWVNIKTAFGFAVGLFILIALLQHVIPLWVTFGVMGLIASLFVFPLIPGAIESLANDPNRHRQGLTTPEDKAAPIYPKSEFGFFTFLQPGRVKIIVRGHRFMRAIMRYENHMFLGEQENPLKPTHHEYWQVVKTPAGYRDSGPVPVPWTKYSGFDWFLWTLYSPFSFIFFLWRRFVYRWTGGVFTGIDPFQRVRAYPLEHFKRITGPGGIATYERIVDYSDHYRVADFQFPLRLPHVNTADKVPVTIDVNVIARAFNPYLINYNTDDDWGSRFSASIADAVTTYARTRPYKEVLSSSEAKRRELVEVIEKIGPPDTKKGPVCDFGLEVEIAQLLDVSQAPMTDDERRLADEAFAEIDSNAAVKRAVGQAAQIRETGAALHEHPNAALVVQMDALVKAAQAAGPNGNMVILPMGTSMTPGEAGIQQELRRTRRRD